MTRKAIPDFISSLLDRSLVLIALGCCTTAVQAQPYTFTTLAGLAGATANSVDGTGSAARFSSPTGVAVDSSGNVYVADYYNQTIRKVTSTGVVTTLAGTPGTYGTADGTGSAAGFYNPTGVAVDSAGNLYVSDNGNSTIRKITSTGVVTTLAGMPGVDGAVDGIGAAARFNYPNGVAVDSAGNVYVADLQNRTIRKITSAGVVTTLAGSPRTSGSADGIGSAARFSFPSGVAVDSAGNLYVSDQGNHTIRKITSSGVVTTLAGLAENFGSADGTGSAARFYFQTGGIPNGIAVDRTGNVYVADQANHTIRKITSGGVVTTVGGTAGVSGSANGTGSTARFFNPSGLAIDSAGNLYVGDFSNYTIRSSAAIVAVGPTNSLTNLSVRTTMASGQTLIVGAVISGGAKNILIRAAGPALNKFALTGMVDPRLELYTTGTVATATNDDWPGTLTTTFASVGAFAFDSGSRDAALSQSLNGAFTVQAKGTGPGTVLVEAYDVTGGVSPRLINLSARNRVGTGADLLVAGFVLAGTGNKQVLIRAVGPGLAPFNVPGVLADPVLQVFNSSGVVIATNDDWAAALATTFTQVGAFALPASSRDAALLVTLAAGASYTAVVSGLNGGTGEALVEVYEVF